MNPVAVLLDMFSLVAASDAGGSMELSVHGDAAVAATRAWAAARGIEVQASEQRHNITGRGYTVAVNVAKLSDSQRVTAYGDWRRVEVAPCTDAPCPDADAHLAAGGAA